MARRPYSTACRFFKDSDQVVTIRWYPAAEPIETLPFPSKINSLDWSSNPWLADGVGEVWGEPRPYNGAKALPYAVGLTPCKPAAVFVEGEVLDPDAPPQVYNLDHFPACCLDQWIPIGGIEWGGSALVTLMPAPGTNCANAATLDLGIWYEFTITPGQNPWWEWVGLTPGDDYRMRAEITIVTPGVGIPSAGFGNGPACSAFVPPVGTPFTPFPIDQVRTMPVGTTRLTLGFFLLGGTTDVVKYRWRVDPD